MEKVIISRDSKPWLAEQLQINPQIVKLSRETAIPFSSYQ